MTFSFTSGRVLLRAGQSAGEGLRVSSAVFRYRQYRFISFEDFPWFRSATIDQLFEVELFHEAHLYWPGLDVDLDLDRIERPEEYPLIAQPQD